MLLVFYELMVKDQTPKLSSGVTSGLPGTHGYLGSVGVVFSKELGQLEVGLVSVPINTNLSLLRANVWGNTCFQTPNVGSVSLMRKYINAPVYLEKGQGLGPLGQIVGSLLTSVGPQRP